MDSKASFKWDAALPSPEPPPLPPEQSLQMNGATTPLFMPTFMKALEMISSAIPAVSIEAKNSTLVDALFKNQQIKGTMFHLALMLTSTVAELIDKTKNPRTYGTVKFIRNVLALEKLYHSIKEKFIVRGGTNLDDWANIKRLVTKTAPGLPLNANISYVPPGLTDAGTFITSIGCNSIQPSTYYAMYKCDVDHTVVDMDMAIRSCFNLEAWPTAKKSYKVESLFRYSQDIQMVTEDNSSMKFILAKASSEFYWLQVFKVTLVDAYGNRNEFESPFYIVIYTPNFGATKGGSETVEIAETNFVQLMMIDKATVADMSMLESFIERRRISSMGVAQAFLKKMKFSMYDPETSVIGVSNTFGADSSNNTRFYSRITSYSGKDAVHVLPEYDTIRDALGKCIEMGKSRGYAFVGAPGTGKTIMMNQLINEFPSAPVVKFSMQGFCDPVQPNQSSLLQSILDVVQSLSDAGFSKIFLCCDDIDSVDMSTKNLSVENLINLLDGLHSRLTNSTAIVFMCTVNDPTKMHSTIIKRGKRIDEVIEVPCPSEETIHRLINSLKDKEDPTDYTDPAFAQAITRMANDKFSLADLSTMMTTLQIYGAPDDSGKFTPETLETAISRIELSKANAAKTYEV